MKLKAVWLVTLAVLFTFSVMGAEEPSMKLIGGLESRPSWDSLTGIFRTENSVEAGAQLSPKVALSYAQAVTTNIYNPQVPDSQGGVNAKLDVGFIRTKVKDIWTNDSDLSISYQNRAYLPVNEAASKNENLLVLRNYFTLSKKVSDTVKLSVSEIPILFINGKAGVGRSANKVFENRIYLVANLQLTEKLSLGLPLMFHQTRTANFSDSAANNNQWLHHVWIYPELTYAIDTTYSVGAAYYNSTSLVAPDLSGVQIGKGLEDGAYQLIFAAAL